MDHLTDVEFARDIDTNPMHAPAVRGEEAPLCWHVPGATSPGGPHSNSTCGLRGFGLASTLLATVFSTYALSVLKVYRRLREKRSLCGFPAKIFW